MIKKILFLLFLTVPTLFDIFILFVYFIPFFISGLSLYDIFTFEVFSFGFFTLLIFFLMVGVYNLVSLRKQKDPAAKSVISFLSHQEFLIATSCIMPLSTLGSALFFMNFGSYLPSSINFDLFPLIFFIIKLGLIILMSCIIAFFPQRYLRYGKIIVSTALFLLVLGLIIIYILFSQEGQPDYYATFPLDDLKAVYIVNYDGDYWITYYHVSQSCTQIENRKQCRQIYEKIGNAAITESPVDLKPFIDKHVTITGEFIKMQGLLEGKYKKICIKGTCAVSSGPGQWVSSPLKITSIREAH